MAELQDLQQLVEQLQQQVNEAQQQAQAAQNAANAAVAAGAQAQQPPAQQLPAPFALSPALAVTGVIDYTTTAGAKIWKAAIYPLKDEFDANAANLKTFLDQLNDQSKQFGWEDILTIPVGQNETKNLISSYGEVTLAQVRTHAQTYVAAQDCRAQASQQMFHCIMSTLTSTAEAKV
jgi:hypothetical protein